MTPHPVSRAGPHAPVQRGTVVFSKCGRDKGHVFVVLTVTDDGYVYLADGALRPLGKPKRKKTRHVRLTRTVIDLEAAGGPGGLLDADIRKRLLALMKEEV